jgi:hypothetical protein
MKKQTYFLMALVSLFAVAMVSLAGCKKDKAEDPALSTDKATIAATAVAGSYAIAVTSNVAWTVTVSSGVTWCTASPASGNGNGTVNVAVTANTAVMPRNATITIASGSLSKTVAVTQEAASAVLSVDKTEITAVYTAAGYPVAVTSNTTWTVTVSSGATWCTALPATGTANGTVTINVAGNPSVESRAATVTFAAGTLSKAVSVTQAANVPTYAASTQTWTFGSTLVWSDAIQIPDCNKSSFTTSDTDPHCRSYTLGDNTWYYYNWAYVNTNAATLCPQSWHVPTYTDFGALSATPDRSILPAAWGYGGYVRGSNVDDVDSHGIYWGSTPNGCCYASSLNFVLGGLILYESYLDYGFQVRCVQ